MAVLVVAEVTGGTAEQDGAMMKALDVEGSPPAGGWLRMAGPMAGGWRIVTLWDSEADFERFRDERLVPALASTGRVVPAVEILPVETLHTFRAVHAMPGYVRLYQMSASTLEPYNRAARAAITSFRVVWPLGRSRYGPAGRPPDRIFMRRRWCGR